MSHGHYHARAAVSGAGPELDTLAETFNNMATRLERTEDTRRRLLADLAHELRTPIATIGAYLEALEDHVVTWNQDTASVLRDQTARLTRLANDIDDVSLAEEGRITLDRNPQAVADLIFAAAVGSRDSFAAKGVNLLADTASAAGLMVDVDRERLAQVLANLLGNALRHTPAGGTVTVTAAAGHPGVRITVTDTGDGITPEQLVHVFERFYRGDAARDRHHKGSGIGLTISKALIDAHGGTLTAQSDGPGHGATFTMTIPRRSLRVSN